MSPDRTDSQTSAVAGRATAIPMWMLLSIAIILAMASALGWRLAVGLIAERPISDRLRYAVAPVAPAPSDFSGADFALLERLFSAAGAFGG